MKIKFLVNAGPYKKGEVVDVNEPAAERLSRAKVAVIIEEAAAFRFPVAGLSPKAKAKPRAEHTDSGPVGRLG